MTCVGYLLGKEHEQEGGFDIPRHTFLLGARYFPPKCPLILEFAQLFVTAQA